MQRVHNIDAAFFIFDEHVVARKADEFTVGSLILLAIRGANDKRARTAGLLFYNFRVHVLFVAVIVKRCQSMSAVL